MAKGKRKGKPKKEYLFTHSTWDFYSRNIGEKSGFISKGSSVKRIKPKSLTIKEARNIMRHAGTWGPK